MEKQHCIFFLFHEVCEIYELRNLNSLSTNSKLLASQRIVKSIDKSLVKG